MFVVKSSGENMTKEIGRFLGEIAPKGTVIALNGELGAGKTVFARGIAEGLGVRDGVSSPSYVIMNLYKGRLELYHFDFYRIEEEEELEELGLEEYFYGEGVALIEWAEKFPNALPPVRLEINILKDSKDPNRRILYFRPLGFENNSLIEELKKSVSPGH